MNENSFNAGSERASSEPIDGVSIAQMIADEGNVVLYFLDNYDLQEIELESKIMADGRKEITFKRLGTDEGGRPNRS